MLFGYRFKSTLDQILSTDLVVSKDFVCCDSFRTSLSQRVPPGVTVLRFYKLGFPRQKNPVVTLLLQLHRTMKFSLGEVSYGFKKMCEMHSHD